MLDRGKVVFNGPVDGLIEKYTLENDKQVSLGRKQNIGTVWNNTGSMIDSDIFTPNAVHIEDSTGKKVSGSLVNTEDHWLIIQGKIKQENELFNIGYSLWDDEGRNLYYITLCTDGTKESWPHLSKGKITLKGKIPAHLLNSGYYKLKVIASIHGKEWIFDPDSSQIRLEIKVNHGKRKSPYWVDGRGGSFAPKVEWSRD